MDVQSHATYLTLENLDQVLGTTRNEENNSSNASPSKSNTENLYLKPFN